MKLGSIHNAAANGDLDLVKKIMSNRILVWSTKTTNTNGVLYFMPD